MILGGKAKAGKGRRKTNGERKRKGMDGAVLNMSRGRWRGTEEKDGCGEEKQKGMRN